MSGPQPRVAESCLVISLWVIFAALIVFTVVAELAKGVAWIRLAFQ
jgi:hypothetical protein